MKRARSICGFGAAVGVLMFMLVPVLGVHEVVYPIALGVALALLFSWWWFEHSLEVRDIAESFKPSPPRGERDVE